MEGRPRGARRSRRSDSWTCVTSSSCFLPLPTRGSAYPSTFIIQRTEDLWAQTPSLFRRPRWRPIGAPRSPTFSPSTAHKSPPSGPAFPARRSSCRSCPDDMSWRRPRPSSSSTRRRTRSRIPSASSYLSVCSVSHARACCPPSDRAFESSDLILIAVIRKNRIPGSLSGKGRGNAGDGSEGRDGTLVADRCYVLQEVTVVDMRDSGGAICSPFSFSHPLPFAF